MRPRFSTSAHRLTSDIPLLSSHAGRDAVGTAVRAKVSPRSAQALVFGVVCKGSGVTVGRCETQGYWFGSLSFPGDYSSVYPLLASEIHYLPMGR